MQGVQLFPERRVSLYKPPAGGGELQKFEDRRASIKRSGGTSFGNRGPPYGALFRSAAFRQFSRGEPDVIGSATHQALKLAQQPQCLPLRCPAPASTFSAWTSARRSAISSSARCRFQTSPGPGIGSSKIMGRVNRETFALTRPPINRLERLERIPDRRGSLLFGQPIINK